MKKQFQDYMKWKLGMEIDRATEDTNQIFLNTSFIVIYMLIAILSIGFSEKIKSKSSIGDNIEKYYLNIHIAYVNTCVYIWAFFLASSYYQLFLFAVEDIDPFEQYFNRLITKEDAIIELKAKSD
jgi:hypothetical protein